MKVFVTGATGFIGNTTEELINAGHRYSASLVARLALNL
jgi:nucleoside-diphosphate-sugar epimerase